MFRFRFGLLVAAVLLSVAVFAQHNYTSLLISQGSLPKSICYTPKQRAENSYAQKNVTDELKKQFILFDEERLQFYINSGRITFGDTVSRYCNRILNKLLREYVTVDFSPQIFLLHTTTNSPLSFSNGTILLPSALLASLSTEDQLAFIIAREVVNIREKFLFNRFGRLTQLEKSEQTIALNNFDNNLTEQELFSDKKALQLIQDAGYNAFASISALKILNTEDTLYKVVDFNTHMFERKGYELHSSFHTLENEVTNKDTSITSTFLFRINTLTTLLKESKSKISTSNSIQQICLYDLSQLLLLENELPEALYLQYLILTKDSSNQEAQINISKILYNLCIYDCELGVQQEPDYVDVSSKDAVDQTLDNLFTSSNTYYYRPFNLYPGYTQHVARFLSHFKTEDLIVLTIETHMRLLQKVDTEKKQITNRLNVLSLLLQAYAPVNYYWTYLHRMQQLNPNIEPDEYTIIQKNLLIAQKQFKNPKDENELEEQKLKIQNPETFKELLFDTNHRIIVDTAKKSYSIRAILSMDINKEYSDSYRVIDLKNDSINSSSLLNLYTGGSVYSNKKDSNKSAILIINTSAYTQETKKVRKQNKKMKITETKYDLNRSELIMDSTIYLFNKTPFNIPLTNIDFEINDSVSTDSYNSYCLSLYVKDELNSIRFSNVLCPLAYPSLADSLFSLSHTSLIVNIGIIEFYPLIYQNKVTNANRTYVSVTDFKTREVRIFILKDTLTLSHNRQTKVIISSLNENLKLMRN